MKRTLTLSIAAMAVLAGSAIHAQPAQREARPAAEQSREQVLAHADQMFERMDANSDGRVDQADREAHQRTRFDRRDADNNGALSFAEVQGSQERGRERTAEARGDGAQEPKRGDRRRGSGGKGGMGGMGGMHNKANSADANKDGAISREEFRSAALARFDRADANSDGTVTAEERGAQREQMRGQHRGDGQADQAR